MLVECTIPFMQDVILLPETRMRCMSARYGSSSERNGGPTDDFPIQTHETLKQDH